MARKNNAYKIRSKVFLWGASVAAWHFIGVPQKESEDIKRFSGVAKGWGSLPVSVTIGKTRWETSIFPDKKSGTYLLPLKAEVRKKESLFHGDEVSFVLRLRV